MSKSSLVRSFSWPSTFRQEFIHFSQDRGHSFEGFTGGWVQKTGLSTRMPANGLLCQQTAWGDFRLRRLGALRLDSNRHPLSFARDPGDSGSNLTVCGEATSLILTEMPVSRDKPTRAHRTLNTRAGIRSGLILSVEGRLVWPSVRSMPCSCQLQGVVQLWVHEVSDWLPATAGKL